MGSLSIWRRVQVRIVIYLFRILTRLQRKKLLKLDQLVGYDTKPIRVLIPSRDQGRAIIGDLYYPPGLTGSSPAEKKSVIVNWHGSGFVLPCFGGDRVWCSRVARETGAIVLDADYRKAPEDPFPAAVNDVEDALKWIASKPDDFDTSRVAVSGFSAGGNLALVAASSLRQGLSHAGLQIQCVAAFYPVTDLSIEATSKNVPNPIQPIPGSIASQWDDAYTPDASDRLDPRVSPSLAEPSSFPDTVVIITAEGDTLWPEAVALAEKIRETDRTVISDNLPGMHHAFDKGCEEKSKQWDQREIAYSTAIRALRDALKL